MGPALRLFSVFPGVSLGGMVIWVLPVIHIWVPGILIRSVLGLIRK
jgi:hypothetical protein